jgi:tRNA dimethylallyltransferase
VTGHRPAERGGGPLLALVGPTASGKTDAAISIARSVGAEIVAIDSTTVYRRLEVGTTKPDFLQRAAVRHHLIDLIEPGEPFSVAEFQRLGRLAIAHIRSRSHTPFLVGGSGLYYRALVDDLEFPGTLASIRRELETEASIEGPVSLHARLGEVDPEAAAKIDPANARRTVRALEVIALTGKPFSSYYRSWNRYPPDVVRAAGVFVPRPVLHRRIEDRAVQMMPSLVEETRSLLERGGEPFINASQIIGYAEMVGYVNGSITEEEALSTFIRRTKRLARHQMAWFRKDPRVRWFTAGEEGAPGIVDELLPFFAGRPAARVAGRI